VEETTAGGEKRINHTEKEAKEKKLWNRGAVEERTLEGRISGG
jgi:hypothetical protein